MEVNFADHKLKPSATGEGSQATANVTPALKSSTIPLRLKNREVDEQTFGRTPA